MQRVDPKAVHVWRWQAVVIAAALAVPVSIVTAKAPGSFWLLLPVVYAALVILLIWKLPPAYHAALSFKMDEHGIAIERGILWRSRIALPRIRVQHSDVSQGPLQRRFGIATLKLYTAGTRYTKIELPGLAHETALALRDALIARGGDSGV